MNDPIRQQAINKIASAITSMPAPSFPAEEQDPEEPGLRAALYFTTAKAEVGDVYCHWIIRYASGACSTKRPIRRFSTSGMTDEEVLNEVVMNAVSRITEDGFGVVKLFIAQDELRAKFAEALPFFRNLRLLDMDDAKGKILSDNAKLLVKTRAQSMEIDYERNHDKAAAFKRSGISKNRYVYVDADYTPESEKIGYGYVIKDVNKNAVWNLIYGAGISSINPVNGSTGAELRAIRNTLLLSHIIDSNIRNGYRVLTVYSDSLLGIRLINSKLNGTTPQIDQEVLPYWDKLANEIAEISRRTPYIQFAWVNGHSADLLNNTADRLAKTARRVATGEMAPESLKPAKDAIADSLTASLTDADVRVQTVEHKASIKPKG